MISFDSVPESISKDWILSKLPEEEIFNFYGLTVRDDKFCSPLRNDKRPTCNFYRDNKNRLVYRDWATNHYFDAIGYVMWKYGISYGHALQRIHEDMILRNPGSKPIKGTTVRITKKQPSRIRIKKRNYSQWDENYWRQYGLSSKVLDFYNVYAVERAWLNDEPFYLYDHNDPCFAYRFGYEEYKLYFPMREQHRFISSTKRIQGINQLPQTADWLVITKSLKDVMLLHRFGIAAIAMQGEAIIPDNELIEKFTGRFQNIVMFYDNDERGILSMQKAKKLIPCVWIPRKYEAKDITDYYKEYGKEATFELIFYAMRKVEKYLALHKR